MKSFAERLAAAQAHKRQKVQGAAVPPTTDNEQDEEVVCNVPLFTTLDDVERQCHTICCREIPPWGWKSTGVVLLQFNDAVGDRASVMAWIASCQFVDVEPPVATVVERAIMSPHTPVLCGVTAHNVDTVARLVKHQTCVIAVTDPFDPIYLPLCTISKATVVRRMPPLKEAHVLKCMDVARNAWVVDDAPFPRDDYAVLATRQDGTLNPMAAVQAMHFEYVVCGGRFAHTTNVCSGTIGHHGDPWQAVHEASTMTRSVPQSLDYASYCAVNEATSLDDAIVRTELMSQVPYDYRMPIDAAMLMASAAASSTNPQRSMAAYRRHLAHQRDHRRHFDDWGIAFTAPPELSLQECFNRAWQVTPKHVQQSLKEWLTTTTTCPINTTPLDLAEWAAASSHRMLVTHVMWRQAWAKLATFDTKDYLHTLRQIKQSLPY